jgi:hypothetical protein
MIDARAPSKTARRGAFAALLFAGTVLGGQAAFANDVIVTQDNTPVLNRPTGHVVTRVDSGFEMTVLRQRGQWLEVTSPQFGSSEGLWVPAARVGAIVATPTVAVAPQFRIVGTDVAATGSVSVVTPQFRIVGPTQQTTVAVTTPVDVAAPVVQTGTIMSSVETVAPVGNNRVDVVVTTPAVSARTAVTPQLQGRALTTSTPSNRAAVVAAPSTAAPATTSVSVSIENTTPAVGAVVQAPATTNPSLGNPTPAFSGNLTPAFTGNPTPPVSGQTTPNSTTVGTRGVVVSGGRTTVTVR